MTDPLPADVAGVERTAAYCAGNPQAAATRALLLGLERRAHATGWDGPNSRPQLFQLNVQDADSRTLRHSWCDGFTAMLRMLVDANGGNVGAGMVTLAETCEAATQIARSGTVPDGFPVEAAAAVAGEYPALMAAGAAGDDLAGRDAGWRMFGYGFRAECWLASDDSPGARQAAERHELHTYAHRREARVVYLAGRDGTTWVVTRHRGARPYAVVQLPESDTGHRGLIVNSLGRMVRAAVNKPGASGAGRCT